MAGQHNLFGDSFHFNERFLQDHAGQIVSDPRIAVIELIANAYDAGAQNVAIKWPDEPGGLFSVTDDGVGLTRKQFEHRWTFFNYNRMEEQGADVTFPPGVRGIRRIAFGQSGKGRYAPFCFARRYTVESRKEGASFKATVSLTEGGSAPFVLDDIQEGKKKGHGTTISVNIHNATRLLAVDDIRNLIGSKFLVDPSISLVVNDTTVELLDLSGVDSEDLTIDPYGGVVIHFIDAEKHSRVAKLNGIAWWVNRKMVGEPTWNRFGGDGVYLDKRKGTGRRFSIIVEADFLKPEVNSTWQSFHASRKVLEVQEAVHAYIEKRLHDAMADVRRERKLAVLRESQDTIRELPRISKKVVTQFIDQVQEQCPTLSEQDLSRTVHILSCLEQSRDGYDLLHQLEKCSPGDLDTWNRLMKQWTATSAEIVLSELHRRLRLIESMRALVDNPKADELHELHPLFERGLWIFGPEFEAVDFRSNRGLTEIIRRFLGPSEYKSSTERPDLVALPDRSIGTYSADAYKDGEVCGVRKVLIIELKKGGFRVKQQEMDQARDYAKAINMSGKVNRSTILEAFVLGETLEESLEPATQGNITVTPMVYDVVLRKAETRTFNLQKKLKAVEPPLPLDKEMEDVISDESSLFDDRRE